MGKECNRPRYIKNDAPGILSAPLRSGVLAGEWKINSAVRCPVAQHESFRVPQSRTSYPYQIRFWFGSYASVPKQIQSSDCFYPAAGNRNNGSLNNVASNGYYWSASPNGTNNGFYLNFNGTNVNPSNNNGRANGNSVRCVQAFIPFFQTVPGCIPRPFSEYLSENDMKISRDFLMDDLIRAYYGARKNKRNTINQLRFEADMERNLFELCERIQNRTYKPRTSIAFIVTEPVKREIFAADFSDRVVHHLYFNYVNQLFERTFIDDSYSCRKGKGTHYGIGRLDHHIRSCSNNYTRPCYVMKLDIQGYFMSINKQILYNKVIKTLLKYFYRRDSDGILWRDKLDFSLIKYLSKVIIFHNPTKDYRMKGSWDDWQGLPPSKSLFNSAEGYGLPIGNLTSQLFSNIYMADFDNYVKRELKIKHYGRYVDDFYLLHPSKEVLLNCKAKIDTYLTNNLHLTLHPCKVHLQQHQKGVSYLGAFIKPYRIYVSTRTKSNFKTMLYTVQSSGGETEKLAVRINSYLGIVSHYKSYRLQRRILARHSWVFKYGSVQRCGKVYRLQRNAPNMILVS